MEEQLNEYQRKDIIFIQRIGIGCQGQVYQVQLLPLRTRYALKVISIGLLSHHDHNRVQFQIQSNLKLSTTIGSPYFPILKDYWVNSAQINLLFQLCESNCEAKIQKLLNYSERYNYLTVVCFDMLMALSVLKDMNIIHRDIKSENILVKEGIFKLADLGLCRWCDSGERLTNNVGNRLGRSPEFLSGKYSCKTDVWSLGMHLFYMLENTLPFDEQSLLRIKNNPNDIQMVIASNKMRVDLQPSGKKSKNILSFLHLILSEMIVVDPDHRREPAYLLSVYFPHQRAIEMKNIAKIGLLGYLYERDTFGQYYLIMLLAYVDFYRLDTKLKQDGPSNKKKICLKVKSVICEIIRMVKNKVCHFNSQCLISSFNLMLQTWERQLANENIFTSPLQDINGALDIYKISKVKQKFILVEWMVKLYKNKELQEKGVRVCRISFWEIPIDICRIL